MDEENEREIMRIDERDEMEAERAALILAALINQKEALIRPGMTEWEISSAAQRVKENNDELQAAIVGLLLSAMLIGIESGRAQLQLSGVDVDAIDVQIDGQALARERVREVMALLTATTSRGLSAAIDEWLQQPGRDIEDLLDEINFLFSADRADIIAQTEGTSGFQRGVVAVAAAVGATQLQWYTMQDERVCIVCAPMHGKRRNVAGNYAGAMPPPPAHPRCRCGEQIVLRGIR